MIEIQAKWGANYLVFDEPVNIEPKKITSKEGITLSPGQELTQIGNSRRNQFSMKDGHKMIYEGILKVGKIQYAIFNVAAWHVSDRQMNLFETEKQYRYAFGCVFVKRKLHCFYVATQQGNGGSDLVMDFIK